MLRLGFIGLIAAVFFNPAWVKASEDMDPFVFGDEIPVEEVDSAKVSPVTWHEEEAPVLQSSIPAEDEVPTMAEKAVSPSSNQDFTPPPSDIPFNIETQKPTAQKSDSSANPQTDAQNAQEVSLPNVSQEKTLTETLKSDTGAEKPSIPIPDVKDTWVGKLAENNPLSLLKNDEATETDSTTLESLDDDARGTAENPNRRSNASVFDISGVMLRMSLKQVDSTMQNRGFRKVMQKYQIPNFIKWRNEEYCRNSGVVGYERLESCIAQKAKKDNHQYVQTTQYMKYDTKEEMVVTFSSNFTDNKVIKIVYKSQAANITGNSPKAVYLRNIKIYDFWKKINQKYGKPDDKENVTWGMGGDKPFLKASTGYLKLEDPMLRELDYTRMSREDQRYMNTDLYSF